MSSTIAAFSSITRGRFRHSITSHAARNVASIFTATAYITPVVPTAFTGFGKSSSTTFRSKSSLQMAEDSERPFATWTFDKACDTMEFNRIATASLNAIGDVSKLDDSDLIILGIYGPAKEESDDDKEEEEQGDDVDIPEPILSGKAKELDEELGGAITEVLMENYKDFKHGTKAGGSTPTLRIVSSGSKVSELFLTKMDPRNK